ncbi:MAG: helix-hairpin-helix domain-containing protein [bacterium]|nr:helix-hairpin-helix domain-containing protein [bacterium]
MKPMTKLACAFCGMVALAAPPGCLAEEGGAAEVRAVVTTEPAAAEAAEVKAVITTKPAAPAAAPPAAVGLKRARAAVTVHFLDVDQGDATLIVTAAGKTALIDGGMGGSGYKTKDKGKTVILPLLKEKGITRLDYMVMTHPDFDHIGGLVYILENTRKGSEQPLEIVEFLDPGHPGTTYLYQELLEAVKARPEIKYRLVKSGDALDLGAGVKADVVGPKDLFDDPNNSSIVIRLAVGDVSMLLTGDAAFKAEKAMLEEHGGGLRSTILKAGHHGSGHSSGEEFLATVKPEVIIISAGPRNKFLLPDAQALKRLEATGAKIYRTDYQGTITVSTDGKGYMIDAEREAPPVAERWDTVPDLTEEQKVNINTATEAQLRTLPRIGQKMAAGIIANRPYRNIDDLQRVRGIGVKIMERLRPLITVGDTAAAPTPAPAEPRD